MTVQLTKRAIALAATYGRTASSVIIAALLLSACETTGPLKPGPTAPQPDAEIAVDQPLKPAPRLPASEFSALFSAADQHLQEFDWMAAQLTLNSIRESQTSAADRQYLGYMDARIQYIRGDIDGAQKTLQQLSLASLPPALDRRVKNLQRYISRLSGDYLRSARLGDQLLRATNPGPESDALKREIWHDLQRLPATQWEARDNTEADFQWQAWLELVKICAPRTSPAQWRQAVATWRDVNPGHPAAEVLPGGLGHLLNQSFKPNHVALLLPLSGKLAPAGGAIRDGFLAAYYASSASGGDQVDVEIIDTAAHDSATAAYRDALAVGATMVVGPLGKIAVEEIGELIHRPVPVLALNHADTPPSVAETAMVQLALSPADEAQQIATVAHGRGARTAVVLRPASSWGRKMHAAFSQQWGSLGGTIVHDAAYTGREDFSQSVSRSLGLPASEQRAKDVRAMLGTEIEFSPRRRHDIDAIFLFARNPEEARSIKPLLAYHYASAIPVYATSSIYEGAPDTRDKDLNGITALEIPWLLNKDSQEPSTQLRSNFNQGRYSRLHALGADAFLVQSRFVQLQAGPDLLIRGNTGLLTLSPKLQLQRELPTATFDGGLLVAK